MHSIVKIERLDHNGRGIGKINNKVVFVRNALVGEVVRVKVTAEKKKYMEAEIIEMIEESPNRVSSLCPYFNECGGCNLLHMSYTKQLDFKENKVRDILTRYTSLRNIDNILKPIIPSDIPFGYRNKVTFHVKDNIGFYKSKTNELIPINKCLLISDKMNELLKYINDNIALSNIDSFVIKDMGNCQMMLTLYLHSNSNLAELEALLKDKVASLQFFVKNKHYKTVGNSKIIAKLENFSFLVSPSSFFQVNLSQTVKLYHKILDYCDLEVNTNVLDLYCGTGTIGIFLSKHCRKVLGVEINEDAVNDAKENQQLNGISNINFMAGDTKNILKKVAFKADVIVVDPPRSGLDASVVKELMEIGAKKIVYVSCDPVTLARDLEALSEAYCVKEITPVDMFPQTYHVESVVLLQRK